MTTTPDDLVSMHSSWRKLRNYFLLLLAMVVFASSVNLGFTLWVVQNSQEHWCTTLDLLTSVPVAKPSSPTTNPSREGQYKLYSDFVLLKSSLGCK